MRAAAVAGFCLLVFAGCALFYQQARIKTLTSERDAARAEAMALQKARAADAAAIALTAKARDEAEKNAREQRDALHEIEKSNADMPDGDFLCRLRGVCFPDANNGAHTTGNPAGGMPGTDSTAKHDGGK